LKVKDLKIIKKEIKLPMESHDYVKPTDYYKEFGAENVLVNTGRETQALLRMETDNGFSSTICVSSLVLQIIDRFQKYVIGKDVFESEKIFDQLSRISIPLGRSGLITTAISCIDLLIWDLRSKSLEIPVFKMLGGPTRTSIPAYASHLHPTKDIKDLAKEAVEYVEQGYSLMKMRFSHGPSDDYRGFESNETLIRTIRDAVGYGVGLAGDAWMGWNLNYSIRMMKRLEKYEMSWIEEPIQSDDIENYKILSKKVSTPLAAGEHAYTLQNHKRLIENGVSILQPDPEWTGGITAMKKIQGLCEASGTDLVPHGDSSYTLHFLFSAPAGVCPLAEFLTKYRWKDDIFLRRPKPEKARFFLPSGMLPGFGIEFVPEILSGVNTLTNGYGT